MHYSEFLLNDHRVKVSPYVVSHQTIFTLHLLHFASVFKGYFNFRAILGKVDRRVHRCPIHLLLLHKHNFPHYQYHQYSPQELCICFS